MAARKSNGERLVERLRAAGMDLPEGTKAEPTRASASARANGAHVWRLVNDGNPFLRFGNGPAVMVGSITPLALLLKEERLMAYRVRGSSDLDVDPWAPPHPDVTVVAEEPGPEPTKDQSYCDVGQHDQCSGYTEDESDPETCFCTCHDEQHLPRT